VRQQLVLLTDAHHQSQELLAIGLLLLISSTFGTKPAAAPRQPVGLKYLYQQFIFV
jgi:hypothetical protein